MDLNSKSAEQELRHAFLRFPQASQCRYYLRPLLFFAPDDFPRAACAAAFAACLPCSRSRCCALVVFAGAAGLPAAAACDFSPPFAGFFSFFFGGSFMPESLRKIFTRSSGVFPRPVN